MFEIINKIRTNYYVMKHLFSKSKVTVSVSEVDLIEDESTEYISDLNVF